MCREGTEVEGKGKRENIVLLTDIISILPLMPHLQIMILNNELQKRFQQRRTLLRFEPIDLLRVDADGIDGLPARDGIGADDGGNGREVGADILGGAAGAFEEGEAAFRGDGVELGLGKGAGEGLVELLVGFRDAVVDVVAGGPEGVWGVTCQLVFAKGAFVLFFFKKKGGSDG